MARVCRRTVSLAGVRVLLGLLLGTLAMPGLAAASTYRWNLDGNGFWNVAGNWQLLSGPAGLGYPNLSGDVALFQPSPTTANRTVTIPPGVTIAIGSLQISDDHNITIAGSATGVLVFDNVGPEAGINITGSGVHAITAPVQLNDNLAIATVVGTIRFAGGISEIGGARSIRMSGTGVVHYNSSVNNTYSGTTTVQSGLLQMQHFGVTNGIFGPGALVIGDGAGAAGSAEVRLINVNQIVNTVNVQVLSDGLLNLNNVGDTIGGLTVTDGLVNLGAGASGRLTMSSLTMTGGTMTSGALGSEFVLTGNVTATSSAAGAALINGSGSLNLNSGTRTFTVNDGPNAIDMRVDIRITGTLAADGLTKAGPGVLRLSGAVDNTYTGTTTVADGRLELEHTGAANTILGPLSIGDNGGAPSSAELRLITPNNIANASSVQVFADGLFNMNDLAEAVGLLTLLNGRVQLGSGAGGQLSMGNLTMASGALQTGAAGSSFILNGFVSALSTAGFGPAIIGGGGTLSLNGATRLFSVSDGPSAIDLQIDVVIVGTGAEGLAKNGSGTLLLTRNNTYTGDTNVSGGPLLVNGSQPQSVVFVSSASATIGGTGTVGPLNVGAGAVAPGLSPGILSSGAVVIGAGFPLRIELNGPTAGSGYDQLNVTGAVHIGSAALNVTLGFTPPPGSAFTIVNNDGTDTIDSPFAGLPEGATFMVGGTELAITYTGGDGNDVVLRTTAPVSYFLAEGATGAFFDDDVLIANPTTTGAPVTLTFLMEGGSTVVTTGTVPPRSRITVHVDTIPGLEATAASVQVTSTSGIGLVVERSMFWNPSYYGGHTANAVARPELSWVFAEGSQGFFDTYILVANANSTATTVTMTFLREADTPVARTFPMGPFSRLTVYAGDIPEIVGRSFGIVVESTLPVIAERSMYFGSTPGKFWGGGHANAGITAPSTSWFHAEGATGGFFNTFILLSNPQTTAAHVELRFLLDTGEVITRNKVVGAKERLTINPADEGDTRLENAALSTVVLSDVPIVSERSMYWPGDASPFGEGHNSAGVVTTGTKWGLAEGRVGGPQDFLTYILLANPTGSTANVTITYLREGDTPVVKTYTVPPTSRFNVDVKAVVPEISTGSFGARIEVTNGVPIAVERSLYWNANGVFWAGGTNALAMPIP